MPAPPRVVVAAAMLPCAAAATSLAQSDSSGFDTVINLGTGQPDGLAIDTGIGSNTQLNIYEGGRILPSSSSEDEQFFVVGNDDPQPAVNIELNIWGGSVETALLLAAGSTINLIDGAIRSNFIAYQSNVSIMGGSVESGFFADRADVRMNGGEILGSSVIYEGSVFSQSGGYVASASLLGGAEFNFSGGEFGFLNAAPGSTINVLGGTLSESLALGPGAQLNIKGGFVGDLHASLDTSIAISAGSVGEIIVGQLGILNISGGLFRDAVRASGGSINIAAEQFFLDGIAIDDLGPTEARELTERDVTLSGVFADGTSFSFDLNSEFVAGEDYFSSLSVLTITSIPTPGSSLAIVLLAIPAARRRR